MAKCWETATKPYARIIENTNSIISKLKVKLLENLEGHVKYFVLLSPSQQYVITFAIVKIKLIVLLILTKGNTQKRQITYIWLSKISLAYMFQN